MMQRRRMFAAAALLLAACGDDPVDLHEQGSLQANNTTPQAVTAWHYRPCETTQYTSEISLRRLPDAHIAPGRSATVQIEADKCFDHRFTLADGVFAEELAVTVPALTTVSINVVVPATPGPQGD